ncbi:MULTISPECIES: hypothetical protein [unclassified Streptomyces]|uniref:hypothetical protein n=1 Tax=unclassified Streptomyces TaxID=2593676 RepID=UPI0036EE3518
MFSMPEQPGQIHRDTGALLAAVEHELTCIDEQKRKAKRERRRLRRARRAEQARVLVCASLPVLRGGLMLIAAVAFMIGLVLLVTDTGNANIFFELAAAACALAAVTPSGE